MATKTTLETIDPKFITNRQGRDHVLYAGLLDTIHRIGIKSIEEKVVQMPNKDNGMLAVCHARVVLEDGRVHEGIGDASPESVGRMIAPHIMRMASTRAKGRAFRDALNIGGACLEELGPADSDEEESHHAAPQRQSATPEPTPMRRPAPPIAAEDGSASATKEQISRLNNLQKQLGFQAIVPAGMTQDQAASQIADMVRQFNEDAAAKKKAGNK